MQMQNDQPTNSQADIDTYRPTEYAALAGWNDDSHEAAFEAFCRSAPKILGASDAKSGPLVELDKLKISALAALAAEIVSRPQARTFFEENFVPYVAGTCDQFDGFLTGYFEPELPASRTPSSKFPIPLYRPPTDLTDPDNSGQAYRFDRSAIQAGALMDLGLELVWLSSKTDAYFVHVQGSARLILDDGDIMRLSFAGKTGHAYTSLGKALAARLGLSPDQMTADVLADWMRQNPGEIDDFTAQNRSFIFFQELENLNNNDGPIGAAGVPLLAGRSLAVDQSLHTYGSPIWLSTPAPFLDDQSQTARLVIAQDTGSAITGLQRGDLFIGSGAQPGHIAGRIQSPARMVLLVPNP